MDSGKRFAIFFIEPPVAQIIETEFPECLFPFAKKNGEIRLRPANDSL
jgi:hypothetical protein